MRGRKPKPTQLKVIQGTAQPCRINPNEPKPRPVPPKHPAYLNLDAVAKRVFRDTLKLAPWITEADVAELALFSEALADWGRANARKHRNGELYPEYGGVLARSENGNLALSAELRAMKSREESILKLSANLGLNPSARSRIKLPDDKTEDDLERFLNDGKTKAK